MTWWKRKLEKPLPNAPDPALYHGHPTDARGLTKAEKAAKSLASDNNRNQHDRQSLLSARSVETLVEKVRIRLDYPEFNERAGYLEAVEALDHLAHLAHEARRAREG